MTEPSPPDPRAAHPSLVTPRRRDRGKDDAWIRHFLRVAPFGTLTSVVDGLPLPNLNLFLFVDGDLFPESGNRSPEDARPRIYTHTARPGATPEAARRGVPAVFSAGVMGRMLPAPTALEFSIEYASVVAWGTFRAVEDPTLRLSVLDGIMRKYAPHLTPGEDYRPITPEELSRTAVHVLEIERWSGKEKVAEPDFSGAWRLPEPHPPILEGASP